jgi:4-hydroxy-3-methylbut-2-enyl diphosphate reductase
LDSSWLEGVENVGITSGASTPESLVQAVIESLGTDQVERIDGDDEDVSFVLPANLRE